MLILSVVNRSISLIDLDTIAKLEIGMSYYDVVQTLGSSGLDNGSNDILYE